MALARWRGGGAGLLALAAGGAAGGGLFPWAAWAVRAARDPEVREFARQAADAATGAASAGAAWAEEAFAAGIAEGGDDQLCIDRWKFYALAGFTALVLAFLCTTAACFAAACCCCGPLGFYGGRAWAAQRPAQGAPVEQPAQLAGVAGAVGQTPLQQRLAKYAAVLEAGGDAAVKEAALELSVRPAAVREWVEHWRLAHRGPQRG